MLAQPAIELLRRHTGFHIVLIAGVPLVEGPQSMDIQLCVYPLLIVLLSDMQVHSGFRPVAPWARLLRSGATMTRQSSPTVSYHLSLGI